MVHNILPNYRIEDTAVSENLIETINQQRSVLPAITHVDFSSRIQTVTAEQTMLYKLLTAFKNKVGYGVLINTSFNVNNEPIVCSPSDAINCFMQTDIDCLVLENHLIDK